MDQWGKLHDCATECEARTIEIDEEGPGRVTLVCDDGSKIGLYWHNGEWQVEEALNTCPGDIAARDAF